MKVFSTALSSGALASLEKLYVSENQIGDEGIKAFSSALSSGSLGSLTHLDLDNNRIGDAGMIAFANAIKPTDEIPMGSLASLKTLYVDDGPMGTDHPALKAVCGARGIQLP